MKLNPSRILDIEKDEDFDRIYTLCNALGNKKRLEIVKHLQNPPYIFSISDLTKVLNLPISTLVHHLEILENAHIIRMEYKNDSKKNLRIVKRGIGDVYLHLYRPVTTPQETFLTYTQSMPVGNYVNYTGAPLLFVANKATHANTFSPARFQAQLIYTQKGIVEYFFDNAAVKNRKIKSLLFSLEICSEFPFFDNRHKSDITFWINGREIAMHTCEGDYGDRRGNLNPEWWSSLSTQYGKLVNILVDERGVSVNGVQRSAKITVGDLNLTDGNKISIRFGNKDTAEYPGGFNVFGKEFGDYPQDILLQINYRE